MKVRGLRYRVLLLACSNFVLQLMGFVYRMALTRLAGAEALGLNSLVMQVYGIVVSVCISGLSVAATALAAPLGSRAAVRRLTRKCLAVYCVLWCMAALPIFLLRRSVAANALSCPEAHPALALMLACIFMTGLENVLKAVHMGRGLVSRCAFSELTEQAVRFALVILILKKLPHAENARTVFLIMLGMTCSEFVSVGILSASFLRSFAGRSRECEPLQKPDGSEPDIAAISAIALPAMATAVSANLISSASALLLPSRLVLYGLSPSTALAEIGVLNSVFLPVMFLPVSGAAALASVLMPRVASAGATPETGRLVRRALALTALCGALASALLIPAAPLISERLFGVHADGTAFLLIAAWAPAIYLQMVASAVLNGAKRQGKVLVFAVTGEITRLLLMLLLTPAAGMYGCIVASALGELVRLAMSLNEISGIFGPVTRSLPDGPRKNALRL